MLLKSTQFMIFFVFHHFVQDLLIQLKLTYLNEDINNMSLFYNLPKI